MAFIHTFHIETKVQRFVIKMTRATPEWEFESLYQIKAPRINH